MSSDVLQVGDPTGNLLDAHVSLTTEGGDRASLIFESQGAGRNKDYFKAYDQVIGRLAQLSATLLDGLVVSGDTRDLPEQDRRFLGGDKPEPIVLSPDLDSEEIARMLRRRAAQVGRRPGATGPGNRAKRVEIRFSIPELSRRPRLWLIEQLITPGGALDCDAVLATSRPGRTSWLGFMHDAASRRAVELHAMSVASADLRKRWKSVVDVSSTEPFDLLCTELSNTLHVEVKGTTSNGASVVVTRNEVNHARKHYPHVALYVVSQIDLCLVGGEPVAKGGTLKRYEPWLVDDFEMAPLSFQCHLPHD